MQKENNAQPHLFYLLCFLPHLVVFADGKMFSRKLNLLINYTRLMVGNLDFPLEFISTLRPLVKSKNFKNDEWFYGHYF